MNDKPLSHGMDGTLTNTDWRPLDLAEVRWLLRQYPKFSEAMHILSHSPRPFSAASVVETCDGRIFVKRHHRSVRDAAGLGEEHRFMAHLAEAGMSVPRVHTSMSGATSLERDEWLYEVHSIPAGVDLYRDEFSWTPFHSAEHARSAGQALAQLHLAAGSFVGPARKAQPLVGSFSIFAHQDASEALRTYLDARPALLESVVTRNNAVQALDVLESFHEELVPHLAHLKPLWTHNDFHPSNLFWSGREQDSGVTAAVDFGLSDRTNAVHDLAIAIERSIVDWLAMPVGSDGEVPLEIHFDDLRALLEGYTAARPMSDTERSALAPMIALCHAEFALSEADYYLGVLNSPKKARMADEWYLLGHARWFRSAHGRKLLDFLRRWAEEQSGRHAKAVTV
ncbi:MAG: phosphotransferase [Acidobacteriota bacterium]|nr:phosphotransferase [Acidobacteriota bacterium]